MKKLNAKKLENLKGGGCMKWMRRYRRESNRAEGGNPEILDALMGAFDACVSAEY